MQINISFSKNVIPYLIGGIIVLALNGCTSYQQVADNDGIYSSDTQRASEYPAMDTDKNNYYQQYFSTKAAQLEEIPEEDLIFTDIEAYRTTEGLDDEGYVVVEEKEEAPYGGWGSNGGNVTVNIYDTGWNNFGWYGGWYQPWGYYGYWGVPYWGWGGYGYYNPWFCNPYYGGYYSPYYYGGVYGSYGYAYQQNRGRSNTNYIAGRSNYNRGSSSTTRSNYSRSESYRRSSSLYNRNSNNSRSSRSYQSNQRSNTNYRPQSYSRPSYNSPSNSRPSTNTRPSYSRPSNSGSSGGFNRGGGGSSRGGGGRSGGGRG